MSFFVVSLVSVNQRRSYPVCAEQTVRSEAEKAACQAKKEAKKDKSAEPKRKRGRPKGSKNKKKSEVTLNPELVRIHKLVKALLLRIGSLLCPVYLAMDGHFGNYPAFQMVRQCGLHLISKLRWDAALCFLFDGNDLTANLDLKSYYRGCRYATEMLKILPQKPADILVAQLFRKVTALGSIHVAKLPVEAT